LAIPGKLVLKTMAVDMAPGPAMMGIARGTTAMALFFLASFSSSGPKEIELSSAFKRDNDKRKRTKPPAN